MTETNPPNNIVAFPAKFAERRRTDANEMTSHDAGPVTVGACAPRFQVIDSPRTYAHDMLDRIVMDVFEDIEPLDDRDGFWKTMPLRLTHDAGGGWQIEVGPYTLDAADVERLRTAITAWDQAVGK